jgi:polyisoprenoid-binding protein YceI
VTRAFLSLLLIAGVAAAAAGRRAGPRTYAIDAGRSRATVAVGKSGLFSFAAGHAHEVVAPSISGRLTVDPADVEHATVHVTIDASALKVTGKGESAEDVPKVQATMASDQVLDVRRFPTIEFESTSISVKKPGAATLDVIVNGRLTLHNQTRPVSVPVNVRLSQDGLTATGHFSLKQTDYGVKPVSVGGVVSVKDTVEIDFTIAGR